MAGMTAKLREKAKPAYPVTRSTKIVKRVEKSEITAINRSMETIAAQNRKERIASERSVSNFVFGGMI